MSINRSAGGELQLAYRSGTESLYTFCMCPGGEISAAASEAGGVVTNGISYNARAGKNSNAALLVPVSPEIFGSGILDGAEFSLRWEQKAFEMGGGGFFAPVSRVGDFMEGRLSKKLGRVKPTYPVGWRFSKLDGLLFPVLQASFAAGWPISHASARFLPIRTQS